jgi:hypothetical protein
MLRYAVIASISLLATSAPMFAQTAKDAAPMTSAPAGPAASPDSMEDLQPGDHWTYELRDEITGEVKGTNTNTVTDVSASEINTRIGLLGNPGAGYQTFDRSWNVTNNGIWRFKPNDGSGIRAPLAVGKTWTFKSTDVNSSAGTSGRRSGTSKVVAQENVTTPAGSFDTFKIDTSYQLQSSNDPTRKYQVSLQTWYAPSINHWVKRVLVSRSEGRVRENSTVELVEYGRR